VSPPPGAGWASEPEAPADAAPPPLLNAGDVGTVRAPHGAHETEYVYVDISVIQSYCERVPNGTLPVHFSFCI
jgi:hypothetical protein